MPEDTLYGLAKKGGALAIDAMDRVVQLQQENDPDLHASIMEEIGSAQVFATVGVLFATLHLAESGEDFVTAVWTDA